MAISHSLAIIMLEVSIGVQLEHEAATRLDNA
jgi:hypothetical protein